MFKRMSPIGSRFFRPATMLMTGIGLAVFGVWALVAGDVALGAFALFGAAICVPIAAAVGSVRRLEANRDRGVEDEDQAAREFLREPVWHFAPLIWAVGAAAAIALAVWSHASGQSVFLQGLFLFWAIWLVLGVVGMTVIRVLRLRAERD
jgi:drug/metabolite transporter (DMT)-like permease